ncbi:conjugal transfer protein TraX (plasmid) [Edwardsiella piscicida]|uniref:conjugal transfer protein TraX n=1 Tax=Edwardsiella TaxID=635 RepID=UPI001F185F73|nr:conjugal transfer protein TraX [Edwardsiella piscicida]UJT80903.1 conjugal transfer protein TraX [Edwardsiella piscicida]
MKKIRKKVWLAANLILPLWEAGRMAHAARYAAEKNAERFRRLWPESAKRETEMLSFDEAVAASGHSRESLMRRYLLAKRIWLSMFASAVSIVILLPVGTLTLLTAPPSSGVLLVRMLSLMFMISTFAGMLFVCAMKNQFHLWQLLNRELGSFSQWRATGTWLKEIFSWRARF